MKKICTLILLSVLLLMMLCSCRWDIWGQSPTDYGKGSASLSYAYKFKGDSPKNVYASKALYKDSIQVSWDPVDGASYYVVYRATSDKLVTSEADKAALTYQPVTGLRLDSHYTDHSVESDKYYYYRISARSQVYRSVIGADSSIVTGWILQSPSSFTAAQAESESDIELIWDIVPRVSKYNVYYSRDGYSFDLVESVPNSSNNEISYLYYPKTDLKEFGVSLYFKVTSVAASGQETDILNTSSKIGYTFVQGAPREPKELSATRGKFTDQIEISWEAMYGKDIDGKQEDYDWEIYRSADGSNQTRIFSTSSPDNGGFGNAKPIADTDGRMTVVDSSNLKQGVVYTYTVFAIGKIYDSTDNTGNTYERSNGKSAVCDGFLLSPPTIATAEIVTPETEGNERGITGFKITFEDALGATDSPMTEALHGATEWRYQLKGRSQLDKNGAQLNWADIPGVSIINAGGNADSRTLWIPYDVEHGWMDQFTVYTLSNTLSSDGYDEVMNAPMGVPLPTVPEGFNATDNQWYSGLTANSLGVYPVCVTVKADDRIQSYNIEYWEGGNIQTDVKHVLNDQCFETQGSSTKVLYNVGIPSIGQKWTYRIQGVDKLGRPGEWSDMDTGYGAITGELFIKYIQVYCLKPWEYLNTVYLTPVQNTKWSNSSIYGYIKQAGTGSLGTATENGTSSGSIKYSAVVQGLGGRVSFTYNKFSEVDYMYSTGSYTMNVNMSGTGSCDGALTVGGMYPASIDFGPISVSSQKFTGAYALTQKNGKGIENIAP